MKKIWILVVLLLLAGCSTTHRRYAYRQDFAPNFHINTADIPNAVPKAEPLSKYGNPRSYVVLGHRYYVLKSAEGYDQTGIASWYGMKFYKHKTSNGEEYNVAKMTAASKVLPLPTYCKVTNLENGKWVIVRVNDRGPFHANRIMDLSYAAAAKLDMMQKGTALVRVQAINPNNPREVECEPSTVPIGNPHIYLQLGAFTVEQNAENLQARVERFTNYPVVIKQAEVNDTTFYRVQIGPIPSVDNTDALHDSLANAGLGEPMAVVQ